VAAEELRGWFEPRAEAAQRLVGLRETVQRLETELKQLASEAALRFHERRRAHAAGWADTAPVAALVGWGAGRAWGDRAA
jgi:hypothetical protein